MRLSFSIKENVFVNLNSLVLLYLVATAVLLVDYSLAHKQ